MNIVNGDRYMANCNGQCDVCEKRYECIYLTVPLMFDAAPKDCDIPTTHLIGDDIILEEK